MHPDEIKKTDECCSQAGPSQMGHTAAPPNARCELCMEISAEQLTEFLTPEVALIINAGNRVPDGAQFLRGWFEARRNVFCLVYSHPEGFLTPEGQEAAVILPSSIVYTGQKGWQEDERLESFFNFATLLRRTLNLMHKVWRRAMFTV